MRKEKRKKVTGSLITEVCLGLVTTLLNCFANKQHISYLLAVNALFSGLSISGPTSCLQMLYVLAYLKKYLGSTLMNFLFQMAAVVLFFNIEQL